MWIWQKNKKVWGLRCIWDITRWLEKGKNEVYFEFFPLQIALSLLQASKPSTNKTIRELYFLVFKLFSLSKIIFPSPETFFYFFICVWSAVTHFTLTSKAPYQCVCLCVRVRGGGGEQRKCVCVCHYGKALQVDINTLCCTHTHTHNLHIIWCGNQDTETLTHPTAQRKREQERERELL